MSGILGCTKNRLQRTTLALLTTMVVGGALIGGCSGGAGGHRSSSSSPVSIGLNFTRAMETGQLPSTANSVVITITDAKGFTDTRTLNKASADTNGKIFADFLALANGKATVVAQAFTGQNGAGELVGQVTQNVDLFTGGKAQLQLTFGSVYTQLQLSDGGSVVGATLARSINDTVQLSVKGLSSTGTVLENAPSGNWSTSDSAIASVSSTGLVTAKKRGTATITFTDNRNPAGSVQVAVSVFPILQSVQFTTAGGSSGQTLTATATGSDGQPIDSAEVTWQWAVDRSDVLTVTPNGATATITPIGGGDATVTLTGTYRNVSKTDSFTFSVGQNP